MTGLIPTGLSPLVEILLGIALLLAGRRLFWVTVAAVGFVHGFEMGTLIFPAPAEPAAWLFGLAGGLIGAVLAIFLQSLAAGVAGFLGAGYVISNLLYGAHWMGAEFSWAIYIVGGVAGFIIVVLFLDWALVILSSWIGATLILQSVDLNIQPRLVMTAILLTVGIAVQAQALVTKETPI